MGSSDLVEAEEKKQSIEIWLHYLKVCRFPSLFFTFLMPQSWKTQSSAKSSRSSLQSAVSTSSLSKAVRSSAKAVGRGVKRIKKGASSIARPLKRAKHALSNVSSPVMSDEGSDPTAGGDEDSVDDGPDVIDIDSGEETNELEKELGEHEFFSFLPVDILLIHPSAAAKKTWRSAVYSFFKPEVTIEVHDGRVAHFFACSAKKCKTSAKGIRRYQDKADKSSTANLRNHAVRCFGEDAVKTAMKGESSVDRSGNIFNTFARQGKQPATYSHRAHSTPEFR